MNRDESANRTFIQVLVPHKNQPEKLFRLLKSIPSGVEVIVVDDNSEPHNFDTCHEQINNNFSNVKLIRNDSGVNNAGVARNIAIDNSDAEWIIFADSDDIFYIENFIELIQFLKSVYSDLVFFDVNAIRELDGSNSQRAKTYSTLIENWPKNKNIIAYQWVVPWGKAIRKSFFLDTYKFRFASRIVSNDVEFSTKIAVVANRVCVFKKVVYCCHESSGSLTGSLNQEKARARLHASSKRNDILLSNKVPINYSYNVKYFYKALPLIIKSFDFLSFFLFVKNLNVAFIGNFCIKKRFLR